LLVSLLFVVAFSQSCNRNMNYQEEFVEWSTQFAKTYATDDIFSRFNIFKSNVDIICAHNAGNSSFTLGINEHTDRTLEEFEKFALGAVRNPARYQAVDTVVVHDEPNDVDWRTKGIVGPVKNQGQCGSCWAFAAVAAVEGFNAQKSGKWVSYSEQQVVDCCRGATCGGSAGCNGGEETDAIRWIANNGGLCESSAYPYTGRDGTCKTTCTKVGKVNGVTEVVGEPALITAADSTVVTVAVCASGSQWQSYKSGIMDFACGKSLNHAILLVGYAPTYYIVRNSWGTSWGIGGYVHMVRGKNLCGIALEPSYAI